MDCIYCLYVCFLLLMIKTVVKQIHEKAGINLLAMSHTHMLHNLCLHIRIHMIWK